MKSTNPYSDMVKMMQQHGAKNNPSSVQLATVITSSPLSLLAGELPLNEDNLLVADHLTGILNTGDTLAVVQVDKQTFIILARVVSA